MRLWRKPLVTVAGGLLVILGIVMLVTPGPGIAMIVAGIAVWASEYDWAKDLLKRARARFVKPKNAPKE